MNATMPPPLLEIDDLVVEFGGGEQSMRVIDGISLSLAPGVTLGIVGESGCGKTMLSLSILRLMPVGASVVSGDIRLDGRSLVGLSDRAMRGVRGNEVGMIFQEPMTALNPVFTVGSQLAECFRTHQGANRAAARAKAIDILSAVGVPSPEIRIGNYPAQLSGGMRQRVMIAMALACRPKILIADEPTTALDVTIQAQILDLIRDLQKEFGTAVIFISHDLGVIAEVADRVAVVYCGRVVEEAPTDELFDNPRHPYTKGLFQALPQPDVLEMPDSLFEIPGTVPSPAAMPEGCRFHPRCAIARDICRESAPEPVRVSANHSVLCWAVSDGR